MALENPDELLTVLNEESDKQKKKEANRARDEHKTCQNRLEELDSEIVNKLCEKILIHQAEKIDGKRVQEIEIYYRFIGKIGA